MSKTEGFLVLDTEIKASSDEKENKVSLGNATRKKLADISNLPQQARVSALVEKSPLMPNSTKEYIDQLKKENLALVKILAERNKIIEVTGIELQRMRVNLQKMQQQNLQLAQSNSQMLADLNSGKDRLKALQHELGCKNGLLKAKKLETEEILKFKKREKFHDEVELANSEAAEVTTGSSKEGRDDDKCGNTTRRRPKSKSLGPRQVQSKDEAENNRPGMRRQSARFRREEVNPPSDQLETEDTKIPVCFRSNEDGSPREKDSVSASVSHNEDKEDHFAPGHKAGNKKPRLRRLEEIKPPSDLLGAEDTKVSACVSSIENGPPAQENASSSTNVSIQDEGRESKHGSRHEAGNKRHCMRRQSARFKPDEPNPSDDSFDIEDDKVTASLLNNGASVLTSTGLSLKKEDNELNSAPGFETLELRRSSLSRPSRQAAKKVQSYKEIPIKIKMRRTE